MDKTSKHRRSAGITFLASFLLAGAWLFPSSAVLASSAADTFKVTVSVVDSIGVNVGENAMTQEAFSSNDQIVTEFATRTASSWSEMRYVIKSTGIPGSLADLRVPAVFGASRLSLAGVVPSGTSSPAGPSSEMVITVSTL